jgi:hypothetical protein
MQYSRRKLIRDAALASVVGAASTSLPVIRGLDNKQSNASCWGDPPFVSGLRVFFIGAWLFCADPSPSGDGMLAVSLDMADMPHTFPHGPWKGDPQFDKESPCLHPNPMNKSGRTPCGMTVSDYTKNFNNVGDLFDDASKKYSFAYFKNPANLQVNLQTPGIRIVALPIPSRILTADLIPGASISITDPSLLEYSPGVCDSSGTKCGFAAAHILDYQGATAMIMDNSLLLSGPATDSTGDYHFHTVPPSYAGPGHAVNMFSNLVTLISGLGQDQISISFGNPTIKAEIGPYLPSCVGEPELDLLYAQGKKTMNTASCAAGGLGIGGGH